MAILNPSFETGVGVPDNWTLSTNVAETYATFSAFGAGHEGFKWGWATEDHVFAFTVGMLDSAFFDGGDRAYEDWWFPVCYESWGDVLPETAIFDALYEYEDWELALYDDWTEITPASAMFDGGEHAYENWSLAYYVNWGAVGSATAQFGPQCGGGGGPVGYEDFEP